MMAGTIARRRVISRRSHGRSFGEASNQTDTQTGSMNIVYLLSNPSPKAMPAPYHAASPRRRGMRQSRRLANPQKNTKGGSMVIRKEPATYRGIRLRKTTLRNPARSLWKTRRARKKATTATPTPSRTAGSRTQNSVWPPRRVLAAIR